ncbi:MAG: GFA family protein, partial [Panacagrimonas sp.]
MSKPVTGGCHCGQLRYQIDAAPVSHLICHCSGCYQRWGPYTSISFFPRAAVRLDGEHRSFPGVGGTGSPVASLACSHCGQFVSAEIAVAPTVTLVFAPTLDDQSVFQPRVHAWVSEKPDWVSIDDDLPQCKYSFQWHHLG